MKKLLALLLCVALLPILPALAENGVVPLFRLAKTDEAGQEANLGSAILMNAQVLLTTVPGMTAGTTAYGPDGASYNVVAVVSLGGGVYLLQLNHAADAQPASLSVSGSGRMRVAGVTAKGQRFDGEAQNVAAAQYNHQGALLLTADDKLLPGAVLINESGEVCGMVAAEWSEGELRYVALTGKALLETVMVAAAQEDLDAQEDSGEWIRNISATYEDGMLTLDWSGDDPAGAESFTVYLQDVETFYYYYYQVTGDQRSIELPMVPGRTYAYWIRRGGHKGSDGLTQENAKEFAIPEGSLYTGRSFTSECYLAAYPADQTPDLTEEMPPLTPITAEALADEGQRLYLQVINTYAVEEEIETSMICSLHTPDGQVFYNINGYIFMPEYQEHDAWSVDVTELFEDFLTYGPGSFAPGEYELRYTIGADWGGVFAFTLE